jgi:hypothetical protein
MKPFNVWLLHRDGRLEDKGFYDNPGPTFRQFVRPDIHYNTDTYNHVLQCKVIEYECRYITVDGVSFVVYVEQECIHGRTTNEIYNTKVERVEPLVGGSI